MLPHTHIVLASTSPYRSALLKQLELNFTCVAPEFEEHDSLELAPSELALKFAEEKAKSLQNRYPSHLIIGSDQVAAVDKKILTKPLNEEKAIEQLLHCSSKTVVFYTAAVLINTQAGRIQRSCDQTHVTFRDLAKSEVERYVAREKPVDCCGSFKIENLGITLMNSVRSKDPTALIGLPLIALGNMLRNEDLTLP